jgi:hypothetical protein
VGRPLKCTVKISSANCVNLCKDLPRRGRPDVGVTLGEDSHARYGGRVTLWETLTIDRDKALPNKLGRG